MSRRQAAPGARRLLSMIREQERAQRAPLLLALLCAAVVSGAAVALLGLSGWFITSAALAGLAGAAAAHAFNYMIPSAMIRLLAIVRTVSRYGERISGHDAALKALAALRPRLFQALAAAPPAQALAVARGEASSRLMQDVDAIQNRFVRRSAPWGAGAGVAAGVALTLFAGWTAALAAMTFALLSIGLGLITARLAAAPAARRLQEATGRLKGEFSALHGAAAELRAYGMTDHAQTLLSAASSAVVDETARVARAGGWIGAGQIILTALGLPCVAIAASNAAPAVAALTLLAFVMTIESAGALAQAFRNNGGVDAAVDRLGAWLDAPSPPSTACPLRTLIAFGAEPALCPPARLAVVGASGAGKTTLIERTLGLRASPPGEAFLDGRDIATLPPQAARLLFSYAPQQSVFIAGSFADNLRLARPSASDEDLWEALADAGLAERVRAAPLGLLSLIGENGAALSGGERRRLGLARAYLRPAPWLVLDEPTEGLDHQTEARVLDRLAARLERTGQGLILVSHRPAPLQLCSLRLTVTRRNGRTHLAGPHERVEAAA